MTAERRADSAESGRGASEEVDLQGEEERRINGRSGAPELSWSASEDDSPSAKTVYQKKIKK